MLIQPEIIADQINTIWLQKNDRTRVEPGLDLKYMAFVKIHQIDEINIMSHL